MKIIKITKLPKLCLSLSFRFFSFPDMFLSFDYKFSMSDRKFIGSLVANKTAVLFCNSTRFSIESRARTKLFPDACFKAVISRIYPSVTKMRIVFTELHGNYGMRERINALKLRRRRRGRRRGSSVRVV